MITAPPGWIQHHGADLLTLYPPTGGGRVRLYQRIRPMCGLSRIVRMALAADPVFQVSSVHEPLRVITNEGEFGAWVRITGTREHNPAWHLVGAVFTDEFSVALDAMVVQRDAYPGFESLSKELLQTLTLGLGTRRRRFFYQPPPAWQPLPGGLVATWYPPEFPRDHTNIMVFPATPSDASPAESFDAWFATQEADGFALDGKIEHDELTTNSGLTGHRYRLRGHRAPRAGLLHRELVVCASARTLYTMRLDTTNEDRLDRHSATFLALAQSARALPVPGERRVGLADIQSISSALDHWID